jgi:hypothetical protein
MKSFDDSLVLLFSHLIDLFVCLFVVLFLSYYKGVHGGLRC